MDRITWTGSLACLSPFSVMLWTRSKYLFLSEVLLTRFNFIDGSTSLIQVSFPDRRPSTLSTPKRGQNIGALEVLPIPFRYIHRQWVTLPLIPPFVGTLDMSSKTLRHNFKILLMLASRWWREEGWGREACWWRCWCCCCWSCSTWRGWWWWWQEEEEEEEGCQVNNFIFEKKEGPLCLHIPVFKYGGKMFFFVVYLCVYHMWRQIIIYLLLCFVNFRPFWLLKTSK